MPIRALARICRDRPRVCPSPTSIRSTDRITYFVLSRQGADRHGVCPYMRSFRPSGSLYQTELAYFLFFRHRVSVVENHFCFFITECLWPKIIFVFSSQSVCGRKSFLFFHPRVSAVENHFCFFITECQRPNCKIVFASAGLRDTPFIYIY